MMIPKFRAWDKVKEIFTNYQIVDGMLYFMDKNTGAWERDDKEKRFILMQSTGLQDKNGIEIFEGDIVRWKDLESFDDFKIDEVLKVEYSNEFLKWVAIDKNGLQDDLYDFSDNRELGVIGNIYENPELLEENNDCN